MGDEKPVLCKIWSCIICRRFISFQVKDIQKINPSPKAVKWPTLVIPAVIFLVLKLKT